MRVCWSLVGHDPPVIHIAASLRQLGALHPNSWDMQPLAKSLPQFRDRFLLCIVKALLSNNVFLHLADTSVTLAAHTGERFRTVQFSEQRDQNHRCSEA